MRERSEPVEVAARDEEVLELVEGHEGRRAAVVPQRLGQVEQPVEDLRGELGRGVIGRGPSVTAAPAVPSDTPSPWW